MVQVKQVKSINDVRDLKFGEVIETSLGYLAFDRINSGGNYCFVSHHKLLVRANESAMNIENGGIMFDNTIPVEKAAYNPRKRELFQGMFHSRNPERNQIHQRRMKLYELARSPA